MNKLELSKFKINLDNVCSGVLSDSGTFMLFFEDGSSLTLGKEIIDEVLKASPDFKQFTEKVIINKKKVLYVKNNFENKKANKYKITVVLPKQEYYRAFPADQEGYSLASKLFETLI